MISRKFGFLRSPRDRRKYVVVENCVKSMALVVQFSKTFYFRLGPELIVIGKNNFVYESYNNMIHI